MNLGPFDFQARTRIIFGVGSVEGLGEVAGALGGRRALVVSDPGVVRAGHVAVALAALQRAGLQTHVFDGVVENPTDECVEAGVAAARAVATDLLVGLGGGSSLDCAKAIGVLLRNGGRIADYGGVGQVPAPLPPLVAVPTTAGTGSEVQSAALISDSRTHHKMLIWDHHLAPPVAILDPGLTVTLPPRVTALTGIDAIAHALESHVTARATRLSAIFSGAAWRLLAPAFRQVLRAPSDVTARAEMLLGATLAGLAIENSMLGAAHACANPLTAHYGIPHGAAVALMLPHVIRFNGREPGIRERYGALAAAVGLAPGSEGEGAAGEANAADLLADHLAALRAAAGLPARLAECGVEEDRLPELAAEAAGQHTAQFNPRRVSVAELLELYRRAY